MTYLFDDVGACGTIEKNHTESKAKLLCMWTAVK